MSAALSGMRCIVTGASQGIGRATVLALAQAGAVVALVARDEAALKRVRVETGDAGRHLVISVDLSEAAAGPQVISAVEAAWGGVDLLVNNAAASKFGAAGALTDEDWADAFQLKLLGYVRMARAVLPAMRRDRAGCIINVVGVGGRVATANYALGAINAAVLHFTRSLADTVADDGVRVLAVNPGAIRTKRLAESFAVLAAAEGVTPADIEQHFLASIPMRRLGEPDDVAAVIRAMASPDFAYATGSSVFVDGGAARGDF